MRLWVRLIIIIIWCDGVKIPLTVNENKSYVLVETAKFESVRKSAVNIRRGNTRTIDNYAAHKIVKRVPHAKKSYVVYAG